MPYRKYDSDRSYRFTRKSLRLKKHNYSWTGAYFVTICAKLRGPLLETPELRHILVETWNELEIRFPSIILDEFIVMPDHVHFIVLLDGSAEKPRTLGDILRVYKSRTTVLWLDHIKAKELLYPGKFWQRNYYDRIIRNRQELEKTRQYIRENPTQLLLLHEEET